MISLFPYLLIGINLKCADTTSLEQDISISCKFTCVYLISMYFIHEDFINYDYIY